MERKLIDESFKLGGGLLQKGAGIGNWSMVRRVIIGPNWNRAVSEDEEVLAGDTPLRNIEHATNDAQSGGGSATPVPGRASQYTMQSSVHASPIPAARASPRAPLHPIMNRTTSIKKTKKQVTSKVHGTRAFTRAQELVLLAAAEAAKPAVRRSARIAAKGGVKGEK